MPSPHNMAEPYERNRLPTLFEVLNLRTRAPVDLWSFYVFMREQYRGVEYLDFWLDVVKHLSLCKDYVKGIRQSQLTSSSHDSSLLLDNPIHNASMLEESDSRRLSAFLRNEDLENQTGGVSRLSALVEPKYLQDKSATFQSTQEVQIRSPNINNAALKQAPSDLQRPQAAEPLETVVSTTQPNASTQQQQQQPSSPTTVSMQTPNTSAIAAAWAQEKRRRTSGSPIRVAMSGGRDGSSRPSSLARDLRSSSIYEDSQTSSSSPTNPRHPSKIRNSSSTGGVSISAPSAAAVAVPISSLGTSSPGLASPIADRQSISSSLYNQGLGTTPLIPAGTVTRESAGSGFSGSTANEIEPGVPATAVTHNNTSAQTQAALEKQQEYEKNNLLLQREHQKHHLQNQNGAPNPENNRTRGNDNTTTQGRNGQVSRQYNNDSPAPSYISRSDIKQSTHYILVTYFIPGAEREIFLPQRIMKNVRKAIEEDDRDDPEVFDEAREYVFQAMQQEAFRTFLAAKALGNTIPFGSVIRLVLGLLSTFAAFWVGFILIFLDWQPKSTRLYLIIPFTFASYGIVSGLYNLDPILAFLGFSETGPLRMIRVREPYVRRLLVKRALFISVIMIIVAACFVIVFALVPGKRL